MKYIITGGGFDNKGAESMLYSVITNIRAKEPNSQITILLNEEFDSALPDKLKNIKIMNADYPLRLRSSKSNLLFAKLMGKKAVVELLEEFKACNAVFDVSGFILSSQWGVTDSDYFLCTIKLAKKFNKKVFIMPQSFGPFNFSLKRKKLKKFKKTIKKWMSCCDLVFAREKDGLEHLKGLGIDNAELSSDIVLQNSGNYAGIYREEPDKIKINIDKKSVLIVPSRRILSRIDENIFFDTYKNAINSLLNRDYNVYIAYYENGDKFVCEQIKNIFKNDPRVCFIKEELNCMEFSQILPSFDFIITSRFHSAVHAYKQNIPCLIIGWAIKYKELAQNLEQSEFVFDCREGIDEKLFLNKISDMIENLSEYKTIVKRNVLRLQKNNCFNKIWQVLKKTDNSISKDLCIQCGICSAVCPNNSIVLKKKGYKYLPEIQKTCTNCGLCKKVCPMNNLCDNYAPDKSIDDFILGNYKKIYSAQTKDEKVLLNAVSGGAATQIIKTLLNENIYDGAFLLGGYNYDNQLEMNLFDKSSDLSSTQKSRYLTVNYKKACKYLEENPSKKIILIATGCIVNGLLNFIKLKKLDRNNYLILGLVCDQTMNYGVVEYFKKGYSKGRKLKNFYFRTKENNCWPGNVMFEWHDGSRTMLNRRKRMEIKEYFVSESCLYCLNKLNSNADIVFGDNYIEKFYDEKGKSIIITRTEKGHEIFELCKNNFELDEVSKEELLTSLELDNRKNHIAYAKIKGLINGSVTKDDVRNYQKSLKKIKLGQSENVYLRVKADIKLKKFLQKLFSRQK